MHPIVLVSPTSSGAYQLRSLIDSMTNWQFRSGNASVPLRLPLIYTSFSVLPYGVGTDLYGVSTLADTAILPPRLFDWFGGGFKLSLSIYSLTEWSIQILAAWTWMICPLKVSGECRTPQLYLKPEGWKKLFINTYIPYSTLKKNCPYFYAIQAFDKRVGRSPIAMEKIREYG